MHEMKLYNEPYDKIKNKTKKVELRLYDEKRQLVKIGDIIEFTNIENNEKIKVKVINLHIFKSFKELYNHFDKTMLGYMENETVNPENMRKYYSKEDEEKYGVVGIEINLI